VVTIIFCRRLAGRNVTLMPSFMCMDWLRWWYNHAAHSISSSTALAFLTSMSQKHKSASPSTIQVQNRRKTICTEEKLDIKANLKKVNEFLIYAILLDLIIVVYIQFVIMPKEMKKVLNQELKCWFVQQDYHSPIRINHTKKIMDVSLLHFYCIRNK
jgi:hypothetical protein